MNPNVPDAITCNVVAGDFVDDYYVYLADYQVEAGESVYVYYRMSNGASDIELAFWNGDFYYETGFPSGPSSCDGLGLSTLISNGNTFEFGGTEGAGTSTETVIQSDPVTHLFYGFVMFWCMVFFITWFFRKRS